MADDEPRIQIKLTLKDTPQTKSNGKKSITSILANFQCGIPSPIAQNDTEFSLFKSRKDKNQLLLVEDAQNQVLYYDKRIPCHLSSKSHQIKKIGIFDPQLNEVNLIPVTYSFNMKSEKINQYRPSRIILPENENTENDKIAKHQDLVQTFGSKFAVANMNKQTRLRKTKDATLASMDTMDTAQLIIDKTDDKSDNDGSDIYKTKNIPKKRKRSEIDEIIDQNDNYNTEEHKLKYTNIFQHKFSKSAYCLFEFPYHENANKISKVYILKEIIPNHIWESLDSNSIWNLWEWNEEYEMVPAKFVQRCMGYAKKVKVKKGENKFNSWKDKLVLYDLAVRFLENINYRPDYVDNFFWQNLKAGFLEQYESGMSEQGNRKKIKYSMTRRGKMRIVGVILLLAINIAFWTISIEACRDIADDLKIPFRVIIQVYRLLGCVQGDEVVMMKKKIKHRNPTTAIDGRWWDV